MNPTSPIEIAKAEAAGAKQRAERATAQLAEANRAAAGRAVDDAVKRGVIPPRRTDLRDTWLDVCVKDERAIDLLNQVRGSAALEGRRNTP